LRRTPRLAVQDKDGRPLPVVGNSATVEGHLPEDRMQRLPGSWAIGGAFMWRFASEEWGSPGPPVATAGDHSWTLARGASFPQRPA
jgi:hypothetical protein